MVPGSSSRAGWVRGLGLQGNIGSVCKSAISKVNKQIRSNLLVVLESSSRAGCLGLQGNIGSLCKSAISKVNINRLGQTC